jgi:hypothetical protein
VDEALWHWERALDGYEADLDPAAVGRLCVALGFRLTYAARLADADRMTRRGLTALGDRVSGDRARLLARLGLATTYAGDAVGGDAMFTEAVQVAEQARDRVAWGGRPRRHRRRLPRLFPGRRGDRGRPARCAGHPHGRRPVDDSGHPVAGRVGPGLPWPAH